MSNVFDWTFVTATAVWRLQNPLGPDYRIRYYSYVFDGRLTSGMAKNIYPCQKRRDCFGIVLPARICAEYKLLEKLVKERGLPRGDKIKVRYADG